MPSKPDRFIWENTVNITQEKEMNCSAVNLTEDEPGDLELGYFEPDGLSNKEMAGKFRSFEFMADALSRTSKIELLLNGLARAVCIFMKNSK